MALVLAATALLWGVIGLLAAFVGLMALGRWMIRRGTEIEGRHHPGAEASVEEFERQHAEQRREP